MRILLASSEVYPYSKTGGLADMVGALARALALLGHKVGVVTPLYAGVREKYPQLRRLAFPVDLPLGATRVQGEIWTLEPLPGLTIYFVDQPNYYQRSTLYQKDGVDYPDNAERFIFFSKAAAELAFHLDWKPEILHVHDWQASLAALFVKHQRSQFGWESAPRTCLTIHNLAYQGVFPASTYPLTNLVWDYFSHTGLEFYGRMNCLKAGIAYSDVLTTVSPRYAREITTEEFGAGLDGLLRRRASALTGILNGVDYSEWDPATDSSIGRTYTVDNLDGKAENKAALQAAFGLPVAPQVPLFGNIGRMVEQKGVELLLQVLEDRAASGLQVVVLGSGHPAFQQAFQRLAKSRRDTVAVKIGYDEALSHQIEAGCDFFLMPSRFEPCGLNQMYSLRYGAIPIVRAVGGLDDSIIDPREDAEKANGIKFHEYSGNALDKAVSKAVAIYEQEELLQMFRRNGMAADFSWERTAGMYVEIYGSRKGP